MKKLVFLLLLIPILLLSCGKTGQDPVKNIEAFAHTYGLVRWFYPGDEVQEVDWDQFATYGISQVVDCGTPAELRHKLETLFTPIAPGIRFSDRAEYQSLTSITPSDTTGMSIVSWQHYGVDLGLWSHRYASKRTNRLLHTHTTSKLAIEGVILVAACNSSEVIVSADIRNNSQDQLDVFFRAAINDPGAPDYVAFCVADSTLKPVSNTGVWQTYSFTLKIKPEHANSLIRYGIFTDGEGRFSVRNISVNSPGDQKLTAQCAEYWNAIVYDYSIFDYVAGKKQYDFSTKKELFDERNNFGDIATSQLASDLYVHVPLALYGTKEQTYPACDSSALAP